MERKKILIIDDHDSSIDSISLGLKEFDFTILNKGVTLKVVSAVDKIRKLKPNVVLLDHSFDLNGKGDEGLRILRSLDASETEAVEFISTSQTPIVDKEVREKYKELGVAHFSGKNFMDINTCLSGKCHCSQKY